MYEYSVVFVMIYYVTNKSIRLKKKISLGLALLLKNQNKSIEIINSEKYIMYKQVKNNYFIIKKNDGIAKNRYLIKIIRYYLKMEKISIYINK